MYEYKFTCQYCNEPGLVQMTKRDLEIAELDYWKEIIDLTCRDCCKEICLIALEDGMKRTKEEVMIEFKKRIKNG